jgi:hypothetical protein
VTGTRAGWAFNFAMELWELHDERGQVDAWVSAELVGLAPEVTRVLETRFGVPFPEVES